MQIGDDQFHHPLGFCQKLFKFISRLLSPGHKASIEEKVQHQDQPRPKDDYPGSEVEIHFKQTEEEDLDSWTPVDNLGSSIHLDSDQPHFKRPDTFATLSPPITNNNEPPLVQLKDTYLPQVRRRRADPTGQEAPEIVPEKGTQRAVSIRQSSESKEKETAREETTVPKESKQPKLRYPPRLLLVAPNINEKSESFIRNKIEAMRKNLGSEAEDS